MSSSSKSSRSRRRGTLPDPKGQPLEVVRATRDEIAARVEALVEKLDAADDRYSLGRGDAGLTYSGAEGKEAMVFRAIDAFKT